MFVLVVNQSVKSDANASELMLNAKSSVCAKGNVLLNKYQKWNFQDYWNTFTTIEIRIIS